MLVWAVRVAYLQPVVRRISFLWWLSWSIIVLGGQWDVYESKTIGGSNRIALSLTCIEAFLSGVENLIYSEKENILYLGITGNTVGNLVFSLNFVSCIRKVSREKKDIGLNAMDSYVCTLIAVIRCRVSDPGVGQDCDGPVYVGLQL